MNAWQNDSLELDHLVIGAASLEAGEAWLRERLGVALQGGGQHMGWGTHNRLLQLGGGTYLELIAPDPSQAGPVQPRPFGLDRPATRAALAGHPRLLHFVMRTGDLPAAVAAVGYDAGRIIGMSRGALNWRISVAAGRMPIAHGESTPATQSAGGMVGILPTLIQWDSQPHPSRSLEARGVVLRTLRIGATTERLGLLAGIERDRRITLFASDTDRLGAELDTPNGWVLLD